jgi:hypothetical protein
VNGLVYVDDSLVHQVRYEITDLPGNLSVLSFKVQGGHVSDNVKSLIDAEEEAKGPLFDYSEDNYFETDDFQLDAPKGSFYSSFRFIYDRAPAREGYHSDIHQVHSEYTPIHKPVSISIKPGGLTGGLLDKALIAKPSDDGSGYYSAGGQYENDGFVRTSIRSFGEYFVTIDTIPPAVKPYNPSSFKTLKDKDLIKFKIEDELSGIKSYRGTINGKWVLMEYDAKNDLLFYYVDRHVEKGENNFELKVTDNKANESVYKAVLIRN